MMTTTIAAVPALTTTFTPASYCLSDFYMETYSARGFVCLVNTSPIPCDYLHLGPTSTSDCLPSGWNTGTTAFYSPGICPSGYTQACSSLVSVGIITETRATCCPSSYICQTGTYWPWYFTNECCSSESTATTYTYTTSEPGTGLVTTTSVDTFWVNAFAINVRYQSTDFASTPTFLYFTSTVTITPTSSLSSTSPSTATAISGGLSTSTRAGIGVGVAIGVILLITGVLFFFFRRRHRTATQLAANTVLQIQTQQDPYEKPELPGSQRFLDHLQPRSLSSPMPEPIELGTY